MASSTPATSGCFTALPIAIFRRVILWSLGFLVLLCAISALQASPVLSWMVP